MVKCNEMLEIANAYENLKPDECIEKIKSIDPEWKWNKKYQYICEDRSKKNSWMSYICILLMVLAINNTVYYANIVDMNQIMGFLLSVCMLLCGMYVILFFTHFGLLYNFLAESIFIPEIAFYSDPIHRKV